MTDLKTRLLERLAYDPVKSINFGDVIREEGVQWENARTKSLVEALVECAALLESANKTLRYVQEEYAHGHGVNLIYETVTVNSEALSRLERELGE